MMIERLGGLDPLKNVQSTHKTQSRVETSFHADSISVSDEAKELAEAYYAKEVAAATPDVRMDRIAEVREKLMNPGYINNAVIETVADKLMDAFGI
ncbi:MAG: flagellar biosynthesis anti-sigma factor FlgM [Spirochaetaceae bacterium]|jgi:negative regulator of flagellin synthesis FlgM|nr:flagellar biosynthesis anti-sigma factor FlgM [Spirochaetaceae bacterium]